MAFVKGQSGNPRGRPKGAKGKIQAATKEWIIDFLAQNENEFAKAFRRLDDDKKVEIYEKLLRYTVPKAQRVEIDYTQLTETQINDIVLMLADKIK